MHPFSSCAITICKNTFRHFYYANPKHTLKPYKTLKNLYNTDNITYTVPIHRAQSIEKNDDEYTDIQ